MIVEGVVRQHIEAAAFQWVQWRMLVNDPPVDEDAAEMIAQQLACNLDALRIAGQAAWPLALAAFEDYPEQGELFVAGFLALELQDEALIQDATALARTAEDGAVGLNGAFEWHATDLTWPYVRKWIQHEDAIKVGVAVAVLIRHQYDPGPMLAGLLAHPDASVRAGACTLTATCQRKDQTDQLIALLHDEVEDVRLAAAQALAAMGRREGIATLKATVLAQEDGWIAALRSLVQCEEHSALHGWISELYQTAETQKITLRAAGLSGQASYAEWLIKHMAFPTLASDAGRAIVDLFPDARDDDLYSMEPEDFSAEFEPLFEDLEDPLPVTARFESWLEARHG